MSPKGPANPERTFGISVGAVLCVLAAVLFWRHRMIRAELLGAIGFALVLFGVLKPAVLRWPSRLWWRFSRILGHVNARVLLTVLFVVVLIPLSLVWRLMGKDPLERRRSTWRGWTPYPGRYRDPRHYLRMY